ncbi:hypothetical protein [Actinomadura monticuli]|uniref:Uncharacterized protein n=1 Tax=Actinomadura monticuli TaxID=3097367 RepID=A0ABV4QKC2_9ACTN
MKGFSDEKQSWGIALPDGHRKECMQIKAALQNYLKSSEWNGVFKKNFGNLDRAHFKPTAELVEKYSCVDRLPEEAPQASP